MGERRRAARAMVPALAAALVAALLPAAAPAQGAGAALTVLTIGARVVADGTATVTGTGSMEQVQATLTTGGTSWTVMIAAPVGGQLEVGTFPLARNHGPSTGVVVVMSTTWSKCSSGQVTVLEAPSFDQEGKLVSFAADWAPDASGSGCTTGSLRVNSAVPTAILTLSASHLEFGEQSPGVPATREVEVRNAGNTDVQVTDAVIGPVDAWYVGHEDFSVTASTCDAALAPAAGCVLTVTFRPTRFGSRYGRLTLTTEPAATVSPMSMSGWPSSGAAPNDAIANAAEVGSLPYAFSANVATATSDRLDPVCDGGYQRSVWFHFQPSLAQPVAISTAGSTGSPLQGDTVVAVYTGAPPDGLEAVVCGDDVSPSDLTSLVRFPAVPGTDYWISVTQGQAGDLDQLWLTMEPTTPDTGVAVSDWAREPATFYPHPDSYLDTVLTTAALAEPADVSIEVVAVSTPTKVLRRADLGRHEADYGWRWDGKTDAGTIVAAGSYLLRHRYRDVFGNSATHDVAVTVSAKRLKWLTTTKVIDGSRYFGRDWNKANGGAYPKGTTMVLKSSTGWAYAVYRLRLGSAAAYRSVRFEIVGRSTTSRKATMEIWGAEWGGWSWATRIGPRRATWKGPTLPASSYMYRRYVYGKIEVRNTSGPVNWVVEKARVTYTYAVLE